MNVNSYLILFGIFLSSNCLGYAHELEITPEQQKIYNKFNIIKSVGRQMEYNPTWELVRAKESCQINFHSSKSEQNIFEFCAERSMEDYLKMKSGKHCPSNKELISATNLCAKSFGQSIKIEKFSNAGIDYKIWKKDTLSVFKYAVLEKATPEDSKELTNQVKIEVITKNTSNYHVRGRWGVSYYPGRAEKYINDFDRCMIKFIEDFAASLDDAIYGIRECQKKTNQLPHLNAKFEM